MIVFRRVYRNDDFPKDGSGPLMGVWQAAYTQMAIWHAYSRLNSPEDAERVQAMETLRAAGNASLPCLRLAISRADRPRVKFAGAVVLHRLSEPAGMETLIEAMRYRLATAPALAPELEAAFIAVGSPDAVNALRVLWNQIPEWGDHRTALASICRIWARLRDPRVLDDLSVRAPRIPDLFEQTVPAFGEMAVLHLERMVREPDPARRILAIRALHHIVSGRSFAVLVPLLRDSDAQVRAAVPAALEATGGAHAAGRAITEALQAGYSTREAVETIVRIGPVPYETLLAMVNRWDPQSIAVPGDTGAAVLAALPVLARAASVWPNGQLIPPLCALLERRPGPAMLAAIARVLSLRGQTGDTTTDATARDALRALLTHADADVRTDAASALVRFSDPSGRQMCQFIEECRPQGRWFTKLQTLLKGGADTGQMATQAMQGLTQWVSRVSKETVERLNPGGTASSAAWGVPRDPRLPELLRQLLGNTLDALQQNATPEATEEMLTACVAVVRALARVGAPQALCARNELLRALCLVKRGIVYETGGPADFRKSSLREIGVVVRTAAAETLLELYGTDSFPLFLEALYAPLPEAHSTAIVALGRLGDARALPHLQPLVANAAHALSPVATEAVAAIRRTNPELMTLLRASSALDNRPETLLRPASGNPNDAAPDLLLRPTTQTPLPPQNRPVTE
jgi:HEAT repeat protein